MAEIILRSITPRDTENVVRWRNSSFVKKNLYSQEDLEPNQHLEYLKNVVYTGKCVQYIIQVNDGSISKDIGTTFIKNIDYTSKKGEFGIFIGEDMARGKGFASIATKSILKIAFEKLSLNRVYLTVMADNIFAIKAYERAGFVIEGVMKEDYLRSDGYIDVIVMGITKTMWMNEKRLLQK